MSSIVTVVCDICGEKIGDVPQGLERADLGVWFEHGTIGIPHICAKCQETTTIADARRRLKLKTAAELLAPLVNLSAPSPPGRRPRRRRRKA